MSFLNIFINNKNGILRCGWRVVIFIFAFFILTGFAYSAIYNIITHTLFKAFDKVTEITFQGIVTICIVIPLSIWMVRIFDKMSAVSLGFQFNKNQIKKLFLSLAIAITVSIVAILLLISFKTISLSFIQHLNNDIYFIIPWLIFLVIIDTAGEEFVLRGYLLQTLARGVGLYPAILITAMIFVYLKNPDINNFNFIEIINLILMSFALSIAMLKSASIWIPIAIHSGWDLLQTLIGMKGFNYNLNSLPVLLQEKAGLFYHSVTGIDGTISGTISWVVIGTIIYYLPLGKSMSEHWWQFSENIHAVKMRVWDFCINNRDYYQWKIVTQEEPGDEEE